MDAARVTRQSSPAEWEPTVVPQREAVRPRCTESVGRTEVRDQ
jgi:hypothetical protein